MESTRNYIQVEPDVATVLPLSRLLTQAVRMGFKDLVGEPSPQNFEEVVLFSNSFLTFFSLK